MIEIEKDVVSAILINPAGEVLLQQRDDRPDLLYAGQWTFFGGAVEEGESPNDAIRRELIEELELDHDVIFWMSYICPARTIPGQMKTTNHVYFAALNPDITPLTLHEGQQMAWYSADEAAHLTLAFEQSPVLKQFFDAGLQEFGKSAS